MIKSINRRLLLKILIFFIYGKEIFPKNSRSKKLNIIFGSCSNQNYTMNHWKEIISYNPDFLILLGDNVYGDFNSKNAQELKNGYHKLLGNKYFRYIKDNIPIIPIWDDHDYGKNDAGKNWIYKNISKELFLDFFSIPSNDIRRKRDGIYVSKNINFSNKKIKIISLDTRFFKDDFTKNKEKHLNKKYSINFEKKKTILGKQQWKWLNHELQGGYDILILLSSFQVLSTSHGWEKWANFPNERNKLLNLLDKSKLNLIFSGDRHIGGIYKYNNIYEVTASSFNQKTYNIFEEDDLRVGDLVNDNNFGIFTLINNKIEIKIVSSNKKIKKTYKKIILKT